MYCGARCNAHDEWLRSGRQKNCGGDAEFWEGSEMRRGICARDNENRRINEDQA